MPPAAFLTRPASRAVLSRASVGQYDRAPVGGQAVHRVGFFEVVGLGLVLATSSFAILYNTYHEAR